MARQSFFDLGAETEGTKGATTKTGCSLCGLSYKVSSPKLRTPLKKADILIIVEAPTSSEDSSGEPFSGSSHSYLKSLLRSMSCTIEITYAVQCACSKIQDKHIEGCSIFLKDTISRVNPKVIIPAGSFAIKALLKDHIKGRLSKLKYVHCVGENIPFFEDGYWVCPVLPIPLIKQRKKKDRNYEVQLKSILKKAESLINKPVINYNEKWGVQVTQLKTPEEISKELKYFEDKIFAFDYETTGIKPHRKGHEIISMALSDGKKTIAFPVIPEVKSNIKKLLEGESKKIAHKMDFEDIWSYFHINANTKNWYWDTILGAHCLHNKKATGLKFLVFTKYGIVYDESVANYLKSDSEEENMYGKNALNNIRKAPLNDLLHYNGLDAFYTYKIYQQQKKELIKDPKQLEAFNFLLKGGVAIAHVERNGMFVDIQAMGRQERILTKLIEKSYEKIMNSDEVSQWSNRKEFNVDSDKDLSFLLYQILRISKRASVDEESLNDIGTSFASQIIQYRKLKKLRDTYIGQFKREQTGGKLYPFFNLHIPQTFRSSSSDPNFQNQPKRGKDAKKIRQLVFPHPGCRIVEYDYKAVEVAIGTTYHKDKNMIAYVTNPKNDMHRDTAGDIFMKDIGEVSGAERQCAKNTYVFPSFYGSSSTVIAPSLWKEIQADSELKSHLNVRGIQDFKDFEIHIQNVEKLFWEKRFKSYANWKSHIWDQYKQNGYIRSHIGFVFQPYMKWTECTNYQIQGTAFHCLLYTIINVQAELDKGRFPRSCIIGQIHDSLVCSIHPDEEKGFDEMVKEIGTTQVEKEFSWISIPLTLEKDRGEVDGDWSTLKTIEGF